MLISLIAVLGTPSSSFSSLIFFNATVSLLSVSRALYTTPQVPRQFYYNMSPLPSPIFSIFSYLSLVCLSRKSNEQLQLPIISFKFEFNNNIMEQLKLTKINWLIHLRKIYDNSQTQFIHIDLITELIKNTQQNVEHTKIASFADPLYSLQEIIAQIVKSGHNHLAYDQFFQIIGSLRKEDNSQSKNRACTWTNCSLNTSQNQSEDNKDHNSDLFININIFQQQQNMKANNLKRQQSLQQKKLVPKILKKQITLNKQGSQKALFLKELKPNQKMDGIEVLKIENCNQNNISFFFCSRKFHEIRFLNLENQNLTSLQFLAHLKQLCVINVNSNQLQNLIGLEDSIGLTELYASRNKISSLKELKITKLKIADLSHNQLAQIQQLLSLAQNKQLSLINIKGNGLCSHPEIKRLLFKLFPSLKGIDVDQLHQHSDHFTKMAEFYQKQQSVNFSFSQD